MLGFLKFLWTIARTILSIVLIGLLAIIITQRVSNNKMSVAGFRVFTVVTESMIPEYIVGDTIITKSIDQSDIKIGDDVTYLGTVDSFRDKIVTHRVIKIEKDEDGQYIFQTKGIANEKEDPKINGSQIFGKVFYKIKSISFLNSVIGNLYGMYFAIFIPFGLIFFIEYIGYRKDKKEELEEELEQAENKNKEKDSNEKEEIEIKNEKETRTDRKDKDEIENDSKTDDLKERRKERRKKRRNRRNRNKE